jgi:hypothetical protein
LTQKKLQLIAVSMRRASYIAELEFRYVYALLQPAMLCGEGQTYTMLLIEYIDLYHDKFDVVDDVKCYLDLLEEKDRRFLCEKIEARVQLAAGDEKKHAVPNLKVIRWRMALQKLKRVLGFTAPPF